MGIDRDEIKKALDFFENDKFVDAKEILQTQITNAKDEYLKTTLGLKGDEKEVEVEDDVEVEKDPDGEE